MDIKQIADIASNITVTFILVSIVWAFVTGKVPTKSELTRLEKSEERAWNQAEEARKALSANNQVLERMIDTTANLRLGLRESNK